ncbi:HalOD1 output domain-containing protein [Natronosalvus vescus]|uniref:HalOD1 output domain-containing protein n=1 Tax=Natronosalvus vescus TaxID=2953881 RepID=UPI002090D319|nr:HalOD1 output domain-containing protein [Natronosalvus vescus]
MSQVQTETARISTSQSVVEAVAEAEGVDPLELSPPLYDVIDPDALDQVFAPTSMESRMEGEVTFSYNGYEVTVCGDGYVTVEERNE